jgi:antitoxin component YwqK of YwqJK toxin-antitoxin module
MKRTILIILFVSLHIISTPLLSQKRVTIYYDKNWFISSKEYSEFYREATIDTLTNKFQGEVKDFYKNGFPEMSITYDRSIKTDSFYLYFPNGNIKTRGYYRNNKRWGIWSNYYENGRLKDKIGFDDSFVCAFEYYDKDGNAKMKAGTGEWSTEYYDDLSSSLIKIRAFYKDTLRDSVWNYYYKRANVVDLDSNKISRVEIYNRGKFLNGKKFYGKDSYYDIDFPKIDIIIESGKFKRTELFESSKYACIEDYPYLKFLPKKKLSVYPVDLHAVFPGGIEAFRKHISKEINLNQIEDANDIIAIASFGVCVTVNGKLRINNNREEIDPDSPEAKKFYYKVKNSITSSPLWIPAKRGGQTVESNFIIFVSITKGDIDVLIKSLNDK